MKLEMATMPRALEISNQFLNNLQNIIKLEKQDI